MDQTNAHTIRRLLTDRHQLELVSQLFHQHGPYRGRVKDPRAVVLETDLYLFHSSDRDRVEQILGNSILDNMAADDEVVGVAGAWEHLKDNPYVTREALRALGSRITLGSMFGDDPRHPLPVKIDIYSKQTVDMLYLNEHSPIRIDNGPPGASRSTMLMDGHIVYPNEHTLSEVAIVAWDPSVLGDIVIDSADGMDSLVRYVESLMTAHRGPTGNGTIPVHHQIPAIWNVNGRRMPQLNELTITARARLSSDAAPCEQYSTKATLGLDSWAAVPVDFVGVTPEDGHQFWGRLLGREQLRRLDDGGVSPTAYLEAPTALRHGWTADEWVDIAVRTNRLPGIPQKVVTTLLTHAAVDKRTTAVLDGLVEHGVEAYRAACSHVDIVPDSNILTTRRGSYVDALADQSRGLSHLDLTHAVEGVLDLLDVEADKSLDRDDLVAALALMNRLLRPGLQYWSLPTLRRMVRGTASGQERLLLVQWYQTYDRSRRNGAPDLPRVTAAESDIMELVRAGAPISWAVEFLESKEEWKGRFKPAR